MKTRYRLTVGIIGFLLALLISLSGQPSLGFNTTGSDNGDQGKTDRTYTTQDGQKFSNKLDPLPIKLLRAEDARKYLNGDQLNITDVDGESNYQNWHFQIASRGLEGFFDINNYYACIPNEPCDNEKGITFPFIHDNTLVVGASIYLRYEPKGKDPKPNFKAFKGDSSGLHWIQFVDVDEDGKSKKFIDIYPGNAVCKTAPYYDTGGWCGYGGISYWSYFNPFIDTKLFFVDVPGRQTVATEHTWTAELYLVQQTSPNNVTIYNGIKWGWHNQKKDPCKSPENQNSEECKLKQGRSHNDPHLATFDGFRYDLQTLGEFILTKSNDGAFEVQTRQAPYASSLSINSAIALKVGSDRVALYAREFPDADTSTPLRINGKPTTIQGDKLDLPGGGQILKQGSTYVISSPRGEKVLVSPSGAGNTAFFNISPFVYNRSGQYSGLLGNVNGNPNDDLQIRGGNNILEVKSTYGDVNQALNLVGLRLPGALDTAEKVYFDQLYKQFANSWRVKQEESLFDYPSGKTTKSYDNPSFPDKYLTLNMLSADQIQKARNACTEAKVTQDLMEGCIFDVGFSGFSEFARTAAEVNGYIGIVNQLFPGLNIPTPEQTVNRFIEKHKPRACIGPFCL